MQNTILDLLSELAVVLVAVTTSSTFASSPGLSVLSSQNELLRANLSRAQRLRQARGSKLRGSPQDASARCAEIERSLNLFKPRLLEFREDLAERKAENVNVLVDLAHRHKAESSDQATAL